MLEIPSDIEGKHAYYGDICRPFERAGIHICGGWEYYSAFFDSILYSKEGVTIYLRLPVQVKEGKLDQSSAYLHFGRPLLIKHIVHTGIVEDDFDTTVPTWTGLNQFQKPLDPDDRIEHKRQWCLAGEQAIDKVIGYFH